MLITSVPNYSADKLSKHQMIQIATITQKPNPFISIQEDEDPELKQAVEEHIKSACELERARMSIEEKTIQKELITDLN